MENYIVLDGKKIEVSDEAAKNLKKEFCKEEIFERIVVDKRIKIGFRKGSASYPIGLAIIDDDFYLQENWCGKYNLFEIMNFNETKELIKALQDALKLVEEKDEQSSKNN